MNILAKSVLFTILIFPTASLFADSLCVKNGQKIKNSKVKLKSAFTIAQDSGSCPKGYTALSLSSLTGPQGPQGEQGVQGPAGSAASPSIENIQTLKLTTSSIGIDYSGQPRVNVVTSPSFTKFSDDTILDITVYGLFTNPTRNSSAAIYSITVDNTAASNGGGELLIAITDPQTGNRYESISGLFGGIAAGVHGIKIDIRGATDLSSGTGAGFNDGGYPGHYAIIREIRIP